MIRKQFIKMTERITGRHSDVIMQEDLSVVPIGFAVKNISDRSHLKTIYCRDDKFITHRCLIFQLRLQKLKVGCFIRDLSAMYHSIDRLLKFLPIHWLYQVVHSTILKCFQGIICM